MKNMVRNLLLWAILLTATTGFGQNPVRYQTLDQVPSLPKGLVPDCDLYGQSFYYWDAANAKWKPRKYTGKVYADVLNYIGEGNFTADAALDYVAEKRQGQLYRGLAGYPGAICTDGKDWCASFPTKPVFFDGYFVCRINSQWSWYDRDGCGNIFPVPDTIPIPKQLDPKPGFELAIIPPAKCDTIIVICKVECPPSVPVPPCDNCCPADSLKYTFEMFGVADFERIGGDLHRSFGFGVEWIQWYLHRNDKSYPWIEKPKSFYGGVTGYLFRKSEPFRITCDTCGFWGDEESGIGFRSDVYFGVQHRLFQKNGVFGFAELRYDWYNSENRRGKFLGDENIKLRMGLRGKLELSKKFPIFRSVQLEVGPQLSTYAKPDNNLGFSAGGFLDLRVNLGKREKSVRDAEKKERAQKAQAQFTRDSVQRTESLKADSVKVDSFLSQNPQPIVIDSVRLAVDTTVHAPRLPWVKAPLPFTKGAKGVKLNDSKTEVFSLQNENNRLLAELKQDQSVWGEFQKNQKKLNRAERKLARREN